MSGIILLVLIGVAVAYAWTRLRGKMKMGVSGKDWLGPIFIVVMLGWLLWASHSVH